MAERNEQDPFDRLSAAYDKILQEVNEAYLIDATVILGKDYNRLDPWEKMEHE